MTLQVMDGFDLYSSTSDPCFTSQWAISGAALSLTGGRYGGGAIAIGFYNEVATKSLPTPENEIWVGFAMSSMSDGYTGQQVVNFNSTLGSEVSIAYTTNTGAWSVSGSLGSASCLIGTNAYHWVEMHVKLSGTVGIFELWIDGVQYINATGANTLGRGGTSITSITFGGGNNSQYMFIDDLYILTPSGIYNNARIGDSRIETLLPNSNAGPNNGAPSSGGSNCAMIDEVQNDGATTTVTLTNTSGQEELYSTASMVGTPSSISAVKVTIAAEESAAGTAFLEAVLSSGGTAATGASTSLSTSFGVVSGIFEYDPHTSTNWTVAGANAASVGCQVP